MVVLIQDEKASFSSSKLCFWLIKNAACYRPGPVTPPGNDTAPLVLLLHCLLDYKLQPSKFKSWEIFSLTFLRSKLSWQFLKNSSLSNIFVRQERNKPVIYFDGPECWMEEGNGRRRRRRNDADDVDAAWLTSKSTKDCCSRGKENGEMTARLCNLLSLCPTLSFYLSLSLCEQ